MPFLAVLDFKPQINFEYFDLIGGKESFTNECVTATAAAKVTKVSFGVLFQPHYNIIFVIMLLYSMYI